MINYTGLEYLKIDMANFLGYDKWQFEDRINWISNNDIRLENYTDNADKPFQYAAAVMAYRDTQAGKKTGHLCGSDACASGIQVLSTIMGCKTGARNTGLIGNKRMDVYSITTDTMNNLLGSNYTYDRAVVKTATMTFYYGSKNEPKKAFGEDTKELDAFYQAQAIVAPGACKLMNIMLKCWQPYALEHSWVMPDGFIVHKKVTQMVDQKIEVDELDHATFTYRHEVNQGKEKGISLPADITHSIDGFVARELERRCNYNRVQLLITRVLIKKHLAKSDNIIHTESNLEILLNRHTFISLVGVGCINTESIEDFGHEYLESLLMLIDETLMHKSFPVLQVHDEFKAHANNMNRVRQVYIEIMAELAESTVIDSILSDITGRHIKITKLSNDLGDDIRNGNYALS